VTVPTVAIRLPFVPIPIVPILIPIRPIPTLVTLGIVLLVIAGIILSYLGHQNPVCDFPSDESAIYSMMLPKIAMP
jgi:hypothetical protein